MNSSIAHTMTATHDCGFSGTLAEVALHSCDIQAFGGRCEDYPCCGHTDGLGCQTTPAMTSAYWSEGPGQGHSLCDHEAGLCEVEDEFENDEY